MSSADMAAGFTTDYNQRPNKMSELKITISQLEDLLDRQREIVSEKIINHAEEVSQGLLLPGQTKDRLRLDINKVNYPHDFNILKRYVK